MATDSDYERALDATERGKRQEERIREAVREDTERWHEQQRQRREATRELRRGQG